MLYQDYLTYLQVNGKSKNTIRQYSFLLKNLNDWKPLESWNKATFYEYILKLEKEGYSKSTIETRKTILKALFTWVKRLDVVEDIKIKAIKNTLRREDILTIEDINKLIETTDSHMYKALIALLFESGARINEVLAITKKDITETDQGMVIRIPQTKTGDDRRTVLCIFSSQFIRNHLSYTGLTDRVFPIVDVSAWEMLKKIGEKSGIEKPISAQKFRHAQATDMVIRGYNDSIIRKKLGWSQDSKVISRYQHLTDTDVIDATLEKAGTERPKQPIINLKQAEALKIADASMQLSKLSEENDALKKEMETMKAMLDETRSMFSVLAKQGEKSFGFQSADDAEAWEPGTGNVITHKRVRGKTVESIRKPAETDYKLDNPLLDAAPTAPLSQEDQKRANEFMAKQKALVDALHAKGGLTAVEKARRLVKKLKKEGKDVK